jgi:hypothetical protein
VKSFIRRRLPAAAQPSPVAARRPRRMSRRPTAVVAAATAMIAALQVMGAVTASASSSADGTRCVVFCVEAGGPPKVPDYRTGAIGSVGGSTGATADPGPTVAGLNGGNIGPIEIGANLIDAIGVVETNPNGLIPIPRESDLQTVVGIPASLATVHQTIVANALTAFRNSEALRNNVDQNRAFQAIRLSRKEIRTADDRVDALERLLSTVDKSTPALTAEQVNQFIAAHSKLTVAAGVSFDNVRTMFAAASLKRTIDAAHARVKSKLRTPAERAALDAEVALIPPANRVGLTEGTLRNYIRTPGNWGETAAAWARLAVRNLPNNLGKRIEAFETANDGYSIASVNITKWLNETYVAAGCTQPGAQCGSRLTERDVVLRVADRQNDGSGYKEKLLAVYCRLYRDGCPPIAGGSNLEVEVEDEDDRPVAGLATRDPVPTTTLFTSWNPQTQDSSVSGTEAGDEDREGAGASFVRIEGAGLTTQEPGTVPLYQYWNSTRHDHFATATPEGIASANVNGYTLIRTEAYIFTEQVEGTVPLFQLWNSERGDNHLAATQTGVEEARLAGYVQVRLEGYVLAADPEAFPPGPPPPVGPVHVADDLPNLSTPTLVYGPDQSVSVFGGTGSVDGPVVAVMTRGPDTSVMFSRRSATGDTFTPLASLGGSIVGDPAALQTTGGNIEYFARGNNDKIYANIVTPTNQVLGWAELPGLLASSEPEVVQLPGEAPGNVRVLVRGRDGAVWSNIRRAGAWQGWKSFGGYITSEINAGRLGTAGGIFLTSDISLVARAATGRVLMATITNDDRVIWQTLGDLRVTSNITFAGTRISTKLFARGADGGPWTFDLSANQSQWTPIGGTITSDIAATGVGIFVRGSDNAIYVNPALFQSFFGYARLDGVTTGNPAAYSPTFGEQTSSNPVPSQTLLVPDANGQLVKNSQLPVAGNQTFSGYTTLAPPPPPPVSPTPTPTPPGNCTTSIVSSVGRSMCTTGSGTHRIVVTVFIASRDIDVEGTYYSYFGPWVAVGQTSSVTFSGIAPEARVETHS